MTPDLILNDLSFLIVSFVTMRLSLVSYPCCSTFLWILILGLLWKYAHPLDEEGDNKSYHSETECHTEEIMHAIHVTFDYGWLVLLWKVSNIEIILKSTILICNSLTVKENE